MKRILSFVMAMFLALGCASFFAVSAAETAATDFNVEIQSMTYTEDDNPAAGDTISLEVYLTNVTDEDDIGSIELGLSYDSTKLKFLEARSKTGTGKKAVSHIADYFSSIFQTAAPGTNPAKTYIVDTSTENMLWDTDYDINNDIFMMVDFEIVGDWGGSTEIQSVGEAQRRADSLFYEGINWGKATITRPSSETPVTNTLFVTGPASVSIGTDTTNITEETGFAPEVGTSVVLKATGEGFKHWVNTETGNIFSFDSEISWIVGDSTVLKFQAVYEDDSTETVAVVYKDGLTGKIHKIDEVAKGTTLTESDMPTHTPILGYAAHTYSIVSGDSYVAAIGSTVNADTTVLVSYKKDNTTAYTLTVENGYDTRTYSRSFGAIATVYAKEEGFSYWKNAAGTILSLDPIYQFAMPNSATTLTAVYDATDVPTALLSVVANTLDNGTIVTTFSRDLADGYTLVESGVLYTRKGTEADLVVPKTVASVTQGVSTNTTDPVYGFVKNVSGKTGTWLVRGYMTYTDSSAATYTIYTDVQSVVVE